MRSCPGLSSKQFSKLYELQFVDKFSLRDIKTVYRIAIDNAIDPVCPCCHQPIISTDDLTIDHIYPKSKGGSDDITNLQPMHRICNETKGATIPTEDALCGVPIELHPHKHHRSDRAKFRAHHRHDVIKGADTTDLIKKCDKYDNLRYNIVHCKLGKKR
ncbi:MAG: HNH endonuclease [Proteobacteria bacterium]|nr:HNH endonuclease [Candidatus Enterousia scatequi]